MSPTAQRTSVALLMALATLNACSKPRPAIVPPPPALEVPVVPPRIIAALPEEEPPEETTYTEPELPRTPRPSRPRPKPAAPAPETAQKPEPEAPPAEAPKPAEPAPATVLRTPQTVDEPEAARRVRASLARATDQLGRVNVGGLNSDAKAQYDTARRFIDQADGALKARNYMFAAYLADKAETLARGLGGR
jgi:hypothetical protein